jgi:hypothetical protein
MSIVTAAGSFGYFVSPMFTRYSLLNMDGKDTLLIFALLFLLVYISFFFTTPKDVVGGIIDDNQTARSFKRSF